MDNTRAQQKALDDELVAPANRLKIGKGNLRLSSNLKSKEPTLQVVLDALKLTPFYKAFEITADVTEIYMQEFWVTVSRHHSSLRFKLNGKSITVRKLQLLSYDTRICLNYQVYDAILPQHLTNQAMLKSEAYMTYHAYAAGEKTLKPKSTKKKADSESSPKTSTTQLLRKMNQDLLLREVTTCKNECNLHKSKGLTVLSEVALTEAEQMKIGVPDVPTYEFDDEKNSWKSSDEEDDDEDNDDDDDDADNQDDDDQENDGQDDDDQDDVNEQTDSDNDIVQLQSKRLRDEPQAENADFINKLDDNIKKIIKDQIKEQVKAQVSKILSKIEKTVNKQLEAEVLTRLYNESKTSHAIAANLSELELKKILTDKMESNKSIHRSDAQKNLYKALVDAYENEKLILNTYGETVSFKRRRNEEDKDEEPSAGSNWGSKRRRAGKKPKLTSAPKEKTSKTTGKSTEGSKSHQKSTDEFDQAEEPMQTTKDLEEPTHQEFKTGVTEDQPDEETSQLPNWFQKPAKPPTPDRDWNRTLPDAHRPVKPWLSSLTHMEDPRELFNELMDTPLDFSAFVMNRLKVDTLTPELLAGPTFELMKGSCKSLVELEYFFEEVYKATTDKLDWNNPEDHFINNNLAYLSCGVSSRTYTTSVTKTKAANYRNIKWIKDLVLNTMESARDVYSKRRIIAVTKLQIVEWHNYKHLGWIIVRRDDDKLYTFKEGDFNRLRIQDIEDMLLFLIQGKLTNLTVEERLAFNVSLRISYLKRREAYTAYSNPRGFIYQNKDKKNRFMRIDELHKFSDGLLNDVRTALDDHLKGIRMKYLPQTIWRQSDRDKVGATIQEIDK
ncbi:hypothetical protein Tco_1506325 [Tanacetum coccineum]